MTVEAYPLSEQRLLARALWKRKLIKRGDRWCACGHTKIFHDVYHERPNGEWEECWPTCGALPCEGAREFCEVCGEC